LRIADKRSVYWTWYVIAWIWCDFFNTQLCTRVAMKGKSKKKLWKKI